MWPYNAVHQPCRQHKHSRSRGGFFIAAMQQPITPRKHLGQNFLTDPNTARKIVGALQAPADAYVVEIGPGTGALTGVLQERFEAFTALEVDARAVKYLRRRYPGLDVRQVDVLKTDWPALAGAQERPLYLIGNLPYNITSPILFGLLDNRRYVRQAVLMMQLEVAQRLVAVPRTKAYGILSVLVQLDARPELLFRVSRNVFFPKPDVTSAVVRLVFDEAATSAATVNSAFLRTVVRAAFNQRRKTLHNSLGQWTREQAIELPYDWGQRRAEELTPVAFVELAHYLQERTASQEADDRANL